MDEEKLIEKKKPEEVIRVENLIDEGKLDEALLLLNNYEQKEGLNRQDKASSHLFQCQILLWQGRHKELIRKAEQLYQESEGLENKFLKVDSLILSAYSLIKLDKYDKAFDLIRQGEELIKTIPEELTKPTKQREATLAFLKGYSYNIRGNPNDADLALKHLEHSLELREELGITHEIAESLSMMAFILFYYKNEMARALKYAERSLTLAKESRKKYYVAVSLNIIATLITPLGEIDRGIRFYEQSLEIFKELKNKTSMAAVLHNLSSSYKMKGEFDGALECIEQAMVLNRDLGRLRAQTFNYDYLIQILVDKGDFERAQLSVHDLERLNSQLNDKQVNLMFLFDKALVLKTSARTIKRGKAEEILRQLLEGENLNIEHWFRTLLTLCELLLTELRMTNDLEVLDELTQFIAQLLEFAEKSQSYWVLCESLLLKAKLSLLTFNIKKAQRFLTKARQIADRFNLNQLRGKISNENEDLIKKLDLWEKLKEDDAPIADRMELARLDEKIMKMIQKSPTFTIQVKEEKIAVSKEKKICLVCRGEVLRFSYICECGANYCGNCAQALTNLENVCWACDVPIDYLKPSKPYKEEEEKVEIGKNQKRNNFKLN